MLEFDIILLGSACQLGQRLISALLSGQRLGLGTNRIPFRVQSLTSVLPMRQTPGLHVARLIDWLMPMDVGLDCEIALQLHSPLRLKQNGNIIKSATPALPELIKQISRRMALLTLFWVNEDPVYRLHYLKHCLSLATIGPMAVMSGSKIGNDTPLANTSNYLWRTERSTLLSGRSQCRHSLVAIRRVVTHGWKNNVWFRTVPAHLLM